MRARVLHAPRLLFSRTSVRDARERQANGRNGVAMKRTSDMRARLDVDSGEHHGKNRDDRRIFRATCYAPRFKSGFKGFLPARASNDTRSVNQRGNEGELILKYKTVTTYKNTMCAKISRIKRLNFLIKKTDSFSNLVNLSLQSLMRRLPLISA